MANAYIIGSKSMTRNRFRVKQPAGVIGNPLAISTYKPMTRLPGVAAAGVNSKAIG